MHKRMIILTLTFVVSGCGSSSPLDVARGLLGYVPPPEETTISQELQLEFERCKKIGEEENCAQAAYDIVRRVKGLEPRTVPKGVVIILEGDGGHGDSQEAEPENKKDNNK
ncbi:hypothetical protein [Aliikangiella coralliicola]|uniref:Uncharacterized protein n=1 Tax=Aliikangiella coralliicola TaxID=2592383 RepID=A0A545U7E1_9GAMM|nr:hypothetical protein [Aliikangiella coralliicola]TQV85387.1 hypothetical protein FLL46_19670 [Aliikangiella coralliicola]